MTVTDLPAERPPDPRDCRRRPCSPELEQWWDHLDRHLSCAKEWFPHEYVP